MSSTNRTLPEETRSKTVPATLAGRWRSLRAERDALGMRVEVYDRQHDTRGVARILPLDGLDDDAVARLRDDLVAAGRVRHPHLATPTDLELVRDRAEAVVVRPFVAGCDAGALLGAAAGVGVPRQLVLTLLTQLLDALDALHAAGVIHGRVGPETVMLEDRDPRLLLADPSRDPRLRLVDVGLGAWLVSSSRPLSSTWLAPETGRRPALEPAVDVYAAGVLARSLLLGSPPGSNVPRAGARQPRDVARLLDALCAERPEERPATAAARDRARNLALERLAAWSRRSERTRAALAHELTRRDEAVVRERLALAEPRDRPPAPLPPLTGAASAGAERQRFVAAARERLRSAVYEGRADEVRDAGEELGLYLGADAEVDADLAIASAWLGEQEVFAARRRARQDRVRKAVLWTGAPLLFALALTGVMIAAVLSSGM